MGVGHLDLFGKKKYEDRIEKLLQQLTRLQKENEDLSRTAEKRDEKIRKLTSSYQESCLALKAAEQKAAQSQASPCRPEKPAEPTVQVQGARQDPRDIERLVKKLMAYSSPDDDSFTGYIQNASDLPPDIEKTVKSLRSDRGLVVLHSPQLFTLALVPPFPIAEKSVSTGSAFVLDPLKEMMETPVIVASVHAGDTFLGMAMGIEGFEEQEIVSSQVKEKHSKGGWSQKRFERLREEDIKNHVDAVTQRLSEIRRKYGSVARFAVLGGDPVLIKQIIPVLGSGITIVERRLEMHDDKDPGRLLDEVYGFTLYRA